MEIKIKINILRNQNSIFPPGDFRQSQKNFLQIKALLSIFTFFTNAASIMEIKKLVSPFLMKALAFICLFISFRYAN